MECSNEPVYSSDVESSLLFDERFIGTLFSKERYIERIERFLEKNDSVKLLETLNRLKD